MPQAYLFTSINCFTCNKQATTEATAVCLSIEHLELFGRSLHAQKVPECNDFKPMITFQPILLDSRLIEQLEKELTPVTKSTGLIM